MHINSNFKSGIYFILVLTCLTNCVAIKAQPVDKLATKETSRLFKNLQLLAKKATLFGHQDDMAYGVNWKYQHGKSDVRDITGQYPGVFGWELGGLENDALVNLDGVPFDSMKAYIRRGFEAGAVITISWHLNNPLTGKSAWDPSPANTIPSILPGGEKNKVFNAWLDKVAFFLQDLKSKNGIAIPVIFRPYHELNGSWFWWGGKNCTPMELVDLWKYTVAYLRDTKQVHQLLYAFNTDRFSSEAEYVERYPGNDWVDIVGFDIYQKGDILANDKFITELDKSLSLLNKISTEKNKIPALTEFGFNTIPDAHWWTSVFFKAIENHSVAYALAWRNAGLKADNEIEYFAPYKGHLSAGDFLVFSKQKKIFFEKQTKQLKLYQ